MEITATYFHSQIVIDIVDNDSEQSHYRFLYL